MTRDELESFKKRQFAYTASIIASGLLGALYLEYYNTGGDGILALIVVGIALALAGGYWFMAAKPKIEEAEALLQWCEGPLTYHPRRHSFTCKRGETLLCYNYASSAKYYAVRFKEVIASRKITPLTPLDYYCVKYIGGRMSEEDGLRLYEGLFESLSNTRNMILKGEGTIIAGRDLERVMGKVNSLGEAS